MPKKCYSCKETVPNNDDVSCLDCYNRKPRIVINNLLMFVNSYRSRSAGSQIKTVVLKFYAADDVEVARQDFVDNVKDLIPNYPNLNKKRVDSSNRSAKEIMIEDILDMFKLLDGADQDQMPKFVSEDATKIPGCPEAAGNMLSIFDDFAAQQRSIATLQESMTRIMKEVAKNTSDISSIKSESGNANTPVCESVKTPKAGKSKKSSNGSARQIYKHRSKGASDKLGKA